LEELEAAQELLGDPQSAAEGRGSGEDPPRR